MDESPDDRKQNADSRRVLGIIVGLLLVTAILNMFLPIFLPGKPFKQDTVTHSEYSYIGGHPYLREWPLPSRKRVALTVEDSVNYQLDTPEGAMQWESLIPPGGGYIELGPDSQRFRLSMFHQMECLNTIRLNVLERHKDRTKPASNEARFCLNYLRQMVLCRSDTQLEQVRSEYGGKSVQPFVQHSNCRDWPAIYNELERLHALPSNNNSTDF